MSFGVTNAPAVFIKLINQVFSLYLDKFVVILINDIWVYSKNEEDNAEHLRIVLKTLQKKKLYGKHSVSFDRKHIFFKAYHL